MKIGTHITFGTLFVIIAVSLAPTLPLTPRVSAAPSAGATPAQTRTNSVASQTNAPPKVVEPSPQKVKNRRPLTGAELYSINCNRCHSERYPTERTAAQWKTIMLHMQVRANLPVSQARLILKYLQDNSGR
ncbi:MAG TPA: hypothetical protein VH280_16525 [Verrucomicrobiae bacterium]|jgi:hypothetical protein|nr:hypothetical protein [Verrucomicrobiae bacterium]